MATTKKKQELKVGITLTNPPGDQDRGAVIREPDWRPGDVAQVLGGPEVRIQKVMTGPDGAAGVEVMIGRPDPSAISDAPTFAIVPASVDRAFFDAKTLIPLHEGADNRHWLTRAKSNNKWVVIKTLGRGDDLVEFKVSSEARRQNPGLPTTWQVRAIRYKRRGFREQTLLTSLTDRKKYPAKELIALYHERWEIELGYNEVKTHLMDRQEALRSKKPGGVMQEIWALALMYNLIRLEMERIAKEGEVAPTRISFKMAMHLIQDEWMWLSASNSPGAFPRHLRKLREEVQRFVLPPRRSHRSFPRAVKVKMSSYKRKCPNLKKKRA